MGNRHGQRLLGAALGAVAIVVSAVLFARYWNIVTPEVVDYLEAGGSGGDHMATNGDLLAAVVGVALVMGGAGTLALAALLGRHERTDSDRVAMRAAAMSTVATPHQGAEAGDEPGRSG